MYLVLAAAHPLVHLNAALNTAATVLLIAGWILIKRRRETAHKWVMLCAFAVSSAFLACYLWYHYMVGHVAFTHPGPVRYVYLTLLASHIVLAATVPVLALIMIYWGWQATRGRAAGKGDAAAGTGGPVGVQPSPNADAASLRYRSKHRRLGRWAMPIWLYVSVTGVVIYVMLYHLWPPVEEISRMP